MVDGLRQLHLDRYHSSGADLIMGEAHVGLNESEARRRGIAYRVLAMPMGLCLGPAPSRHRVG
jgi:hypothetical protein